MAGALASALVAGVLGVSLTVGSSAQADNGKKGDSSAEPLTAGGGGQVGSPESAKPKPSADPSPEASSDALTAGGGSLPGVKPQADSEPAPEFIDPGDAQPPIDPAGAAPWRRVATDGQVGPAAADSRCWKCWS